MSDLAEIWNWLRAERDAMRQAGTLPLPMPEFIKNMPDFWEDFALPARIMLEKSEEFGDMFQLHPAPQSASPRAWVWVVAVREGFIRRLCEARDDIYFRRKRADGIAVGAARGELHSSFVATVAKARADFGFYATAESVFGDDILDLVAVNASFTRVLGRMLGSATVLGYPQRPEFESERPVRVFKTFDRWLASRCAGAFLVGQAWENDAWLHGCNAGIVSDDVAHGEALHKRLKRAYAGPQILVAA